MGLIDTLSLGFKLVQRRVWLMLVPILVDIWFWLGPRLSIRPLIDGLLRLWSQAGLPNDLAEMADSYRQLLMAVGDQFNLFWLLDSGVTWMQGLVPRLGNAPRFGSASATVEVSPLSLLAWVPLLLLIGLGLGSLFLTCLVSQLEVEKAGEEGQAPVGLRSWVGRGLRIWLGIAVYGFVVLAVGLAGLMVFSLGLTVVMLFVPGLTTALGTLGFLLLGWVGLWLYLMLYFVVAAIVLDGVSLPQALWRSANVVARNFWGTLGLALLSTLLLSGFGLIWQRLAGLGPWGTLVGIVGNAFLATGLAAARLIFYQDRYARWQQTLAAQRAA